MSKTVSAPVLSFHGSGTLCECSYEQGFVYLIDGNAHQLELQHVIAIARALCCSVIAVHCLLTVCCRPQKGQAQARLAIADQDSPNIHIYDTRGGSNEPVASIQPHRAPVFAMRFNSRYDTVISVDSKGKALFGMHGLPPDISFCNESFVPSWASVHYCCCHALHLHSRGCSVPVPASFCASAMCSVIG